MAGAAAELGAGEVGGVAQRPEQGRRGVHPIVDGLAVHGKAGHGAVLSAEGRRWEATGSRSGSRAGVAHVELARPDKFNAMDKDMFAAIGDTLPRARPRPGGAGDPAVRAGQAFHRRARPRICRAAIPAERRSRPRRRGAAPAYRMAAGRVQRGRGRRGAPVIAAIHGGCIGAGVDLASACDLRVASADAFFQVAEVDVAITADLGTLQRLGYLIPQGVLRELAYTGRRMGAEEAARYGLVNRVEADREAAIAAGLELAPDHRRQVAARGRRRQEEPQPQPRPPGRGGPARRRLVERRDPGQRRPDRGDPGAARQDRAELRAARRLSCFNYVVHTSLTLRLTLCTAACICALSEASCSVNRRLTAPAPLRNFPQGFPFHAGRQNPPRIRAPFRLRAAPHNL